jgi:integrase
MLRRVLDGSTYAEVAAAFGVTRTAVEKRVKQLARRLSRDVGVPGLSEAGTVHVSRLRGLRAALLDALDRLGEKRAVPAALDVALSGDDVARAAARVRARSALPARDLALFYVLFATGARPLEIARLCVADYLARDGSVRRVSQLPGAASVNGRTRPLFFASRHLDAALDRYLAERRERGQGVAPDEAYRGLDPSSRLFLTNLGTAFEIRVYGPPGQQRFLCRPMIETYRTIFRHAELAGMSPLTVRRIVADRLYERGADEDQIGLILGIGRRRAVRDMYPRRRPPLERIVEDLV